MARLGRTYAQSHLGRPVVVFAPAAPTRSQQTLVVAFATAVKARSDFKRRFPLQGFDGTLQIHTGNATEYDRNSPGVTAPLLGPRPPKVVARVPDQKRQTLAVYDQAVFRRRDSEQRRFPLQGFSGALTRVSTLSDGGTQTLPLRKPLLGPRPPQLVTPPPTQRQQTIRVSLTAVARRVVEKKTFPLQGWSGAVVLRSGGANEYDTLLGGAPNRQLGPRPPRVVLRASSQRQQTITTRLVWTRPRHTQGTALLPPEVVTGASLAQPPLVVLVRARPQPTRLSLVGLIFYPRTSEISVTLTRTRPRPTAKFISEPTVLQTFAGPEVFLAKTRPKATTVFLLPPTTVRVPSVEQAEDTIRVTLAGRTRIETSRRGTHPKLSPPFFYPATSTVQVRLAGRTRAEATRRAPHSRLLPPAVVRVPSVEQREDTIKVVLVQTRPRPTRRFVAPPTTLVVFPGPAVSLTTIRPQPTIAVVLPPTVVRVPAVEQQEDTIKVSLTRMRPRPTVAGISAPVALSVFAAASVTLVRTRPRPTTRVLGPPKVVRVPSVEQARRTIRVALVATRPRPTTTAVRPPRVVRTPSVEQLQQTVRVTTARTRPRPTSKHLSAPSKITINPPTVTTIAVTRSGRTRIEQQRRSGHYRLAPPTAIRPLPTPRVQVSLTRTRPRPTTRLLGAPTALSTFRAASVTLVRLRPPKTAHQLAPPTVVRLSVEQAIRVHLTRTRPVSVEHRLAPPAPAGRVFAPIRALLAAGRRPRPVSALRPPTAVLRAPPPPVSVTLAPSARRRVKSTLPPPRVVRTPTPRLLFAFARIRPPLVSPRLAQPAVVTPFFPPVVTTLEVRLALLARHESQPGRRTHWEIHPPAVVIIVTPGFTSGYDIPSAGGSAESVAGAGSTIRDVGAAASESRNRRRPLT